LCLPHGNDGQLFNLGHIYGKAFFESFWAPLASNKKNSWSQSIAVPKNAENYADLNSVEKIAKKVMQKIKRIKFNEQ
jgi:hypothetical protein